MYYTWHAPAPHPRGRSALCVGLTRVCARARGRRADEATRARLDLAEDGLALYRNICAPRVARLFFVGGEVTTYNNPLTHGLQSEWVAAVVAVRGGAGHARA